MAGVRYVSQMLRALQVFPVKLPGIRQKKLICRRVENELWQRQSVAILEGVLDAFELGKGRFVQPIHDARLGIIMHCRCIETVCGLMMFKAGDDIEHIDNDWDNGHHTLINDGRTPSGPATFTGTGDHKAIHLHPAALGASQKGGDRIQAAHGSFGHGQAQRPFFVPGLQELIPRVGDDGVLGALALFIGEHQRLVWHHADFRHHRLCGLCDAYQFPLWSWRPAVVVSRTNVK